MQTLNSLTQPRLKELLSYDETTGVFVWLAALPGTAQVGAAAGHVHRRSGYVRISADGQKYNAHRLAWLYVHGAWPAGEIDHIDGNKSNNAISNLRHVDRAGNQQNLKKAQVNNSSDFLGVSWSIHKQKWVAQIQLHGAKKHLGYYDSAEKAHEAYLTAKRSLHTTNTL